MWRVRAPSRPSTRGSWLSKTQGRGDRTPGHITAGWFFSRFPIDGPEAVRQHFRPGVVSVVPGASIELVLAESHVAQYYTTISSIEASAASPSLPHPDHYHQATQRRPHPPAALRLATQPPLCNTRSPEIKYLASYEHMGTARVECLESCACEPLLIDGDTGGESFSGPRRMPLALAAFASPCVLRATNDRARTGGG
eukprot:jgi/Tetstr1/431942/TSEL_002249.t1